MVVCCYGFVLPCLLGNVVMLHLHRDVIRCKQNVMS